MAISARRWVGITATVLLLLVVAGGIVETLSHSNSARAGGPANSAGVDFSRDADANFAAAQGLPGLDAFASYAGYQIVSYGYEVDLVGPPTAAIRAVVDRNDPEYKGKPIPVRYRSVRHSLRELQALTKRITADDGHWQDQGIELSSWGPDIDSNTVQIRMTHYTKHYRDALIAHYGDEVSVYPHDFAVSG